MSLPDKEPNDIVELKRLKRLARLMVAFDLSEISVKQSGSLVRLRRGGAGPVLMSTGHAAASQAPSASSPKEGPSASAEDSRHVVEIKSPMVGTFYSSPKPDSPPFVKVGDHVGVESVVCIIEAMKVFNDIQAEVSGKIVAILASNGDPVGYGQSLYRVDTRG